MYQRNVERETDRQTERDNERQREAEREREREHVSSQNVIASSVKPSYFNSIITWLKTEELTMENVLTSIQIKN